MSTSRHGSKTRRNYLKPSNRELPLEGLAFLGTTVMHPLATRTSSQRPMVPSWVEAVPSLLCLSLSPAGGSRYGSEVAAGAAAWVAPPVYHSSCRRTSSSNSCGTIETRRNRRHRQQQHQPPRVTRSIGGGGGVGDDGGAVLGGSRVWVWCVGNGIAGGMSKVSVSCDSSGSVAVGQRQPGRSSALRCSDAGGVHDRDGGEGQTGAAGAATVASERDGASRDGSSMSAGQTESTLALPEGPSKPGTAAEEVTAFCCGGGLDLSADQMDALVAKAPEVLEMSASEQLAPQADRWLNTAGLGLTRKSLGRMLVECPEVFLLDYDSVLAPIVVWLMVDVRVPRNRVARLLEAFPLILAKDLGTELRPRHRWLMDSLQLQTKDVRRLLSLVPELLHVSMEETLTPACDWLMAATGERDMASVGKISARSPELLITEPSVMQECLEMIAQQVFGGDMHQASDLFVRQPLLLSYSDRVGPLVRLMTDELKATLPQAVEVLANDPSIVEFQMERHVLPRLEAVRKAGVGDVVNGALLPLSGKLKVLGKFSEARFAKWLKREGQPHQQRELASRPSPAVAGGDAAAAGAGLESW